MKNRRERSDKNGPTSDFDKGLSFGIGKRKSKKEKRIKNYSKYQVCFLGIIFLLIELEIFLF